MVGWTTNASSLAPMANIPAEEGLVLYGIRKVSSGTIRYTGSKAYNLSFNDGAVNGSIVLMPNVFGHWDASEAGAPDYGSCSLVVSGSNISPTGRQVFRSGRDYDSETFPWRPAFKILGNPFRIYAVNGGEQSGDYDYYCIPNQGYYYYEKAIGGGK